MAYTFARECNIPLLCIDIRKARTLIGSQFRAALVGYAQVTVAVMIWGLHRYPDFYFRGGQGVVLTYLTSTFAGGMVGCAYGGVLSIFERFTSRRIRPLISIGLVLVVACICAAIIVAEEFRQRRIEWIFAPQLSAFVLGLLASLASSAHCETKGEQAGRGDGDKPSN